MIKRLFKIFIIFCNLKLQETKSVIKKIPFFLWALTKSIIIAVILCGIIFTVFTLVGYITYIILGVWMEVKCNNFFVMLFGFGIMTIFVISYLFILFYYIIMFLKNNWDKARDIYLNQSEGNT